jgi:hypothetical protein
MACACKPSWKALVWPRPETEELSCVYSEADLGDPVPWRPDPELRDLPTSLFSCLLGEDAAGMLRAREVLQTPAVTTRGRSAAARAWCRPPTPDMVDQVSYKLATFFSTV